MLPLWVALAPGNLPVAECLRFECLLRLALNQSFIEPHCHHLLCVPQVQWEECLSPALTLLWSFLALAAS
jgi:hypothetical protein